ncbi:hypothetical protein BDZ94DRAFT_454320 [Collybia nuda]|uniref:Uncharacterized protein n=1 Tax=Collybia nuda TaxID=64659 RepID=A0A9P6CLD6_9AGAR|nr:hypothetical protein BDZ94DRAFT_454320 [Collybia nuda]
MVSSCLQSGVWIESIVWGTPIQCPTQCTCADIPSHCTHSVHATDTCCPKLHSLHSPVTLIIITIFPIVPWVMWHNKPHVTIVFIIIQTQYLSRESSDYSLRISLVSQGSGGVSLRPCHINHKLSSALREQALFPGLAEPTEHHKGCQSLIESHGDIANSQSTTEIFRAPETYIGV